MCGIIYKNSFTGQNVNREIRKQYFKQKSRGTDGFGFLAINDGKTTLKKEMFEHQIMRDLKKIKASEIIFHHRWPTSTPNTIETAHPIATKHDKYKHNYHLVHNGIIFNDNELKVEHEALGIVYETKVSDKMFNDSECLLHDLALAIEGIKEIDKLKARGSIAFVLLQTSKEDEPEALYFGKNYGSPLKIDYNEKIGLSLASEGTGYDIPDNKLFRFDYDTKALTSQDMVIPYIITEDYNNSDWKVNYNYNDYHNRPVKEYDYNEVITELDDKELQDYFYDLALQRELLLKELATAQRTGNSEDENELQEEIDDIDDNMYSAEKEIDRRAYNQDTPPRSYVNDMFDERYK